jgi:hypothetical protein
MDVFINLGNNRLSTIKIYEIIKNIDNVLIQCKKTENDAGYTKYYIKGESNDLMYGDIILQLQVNSKFLDLSKYTICKPLLLRGIDGKNYVEYQDINND